MLWWSVEQRRRRHRSLNQVRQHPESRAHAGDRLDSDQRVRAPLGGHAEPGQVTGRPIEVLDVVDPDLDRHQPPGRGVLDAQLLATVDGREPTWCDLLEPELGVVVRHLPDVGHPHGDRGQSVQRHRGLLGERSVVRDGGQPPRCPTPDTSSGVSESQ
jgi:hypothetical protein